MRNRILIVVSGVFLVLCIPTILFVSGWWMPNYPSQTDYPIRGIDVSRHQGPIDWKKVSASGIRFVYLKATEGGYFQDPIFRENLQNARAAGLICGAYHFFTLKAPGNIQAQNFMATAPGQLLNLPPAIDLEFWGNSSVRPSRETFQADLRIYFETVEKASGRKPVAYYSTDFANAYLKGFSIQDDWVRAILMSPTWYRDNSWLFWQYSDRGRVPGIDGFVDLDVFNGSVDQFAALARNLAAP